MLLIRPRRPAMASMLYHEGNRAFQDEFDTRRLADRLEEKLSRAAFSDDDKNFIESCSYFLSRPPTHRDVRIVHSRAARRDSFVSPDRAIAGGLRSGCLRAPPRPI